MNKKRHVVTGVIGREDHHIVGMRMVEYALKAAGFEVVSLGILVSQEEFVKAAIETAASAILVGSYAGHGVIECRGFRDKLEEAGLKDIVLYIGGYLRSRASQEWEEIRKEFEDMGFDRVYPQDVTLEQVISDLKADLEINDQTNIGHR